MGRYGSKYGKQKILETAKNQVKVLKQGIKNI